MSGTHLITRPIAEAEAFAAQLKELGVATMLCPLSEVVWTPPQKLPELKKMDALIATSANGLNGIQHANMPKTIFNKKLYAVGEATKVQAQKLGWTDIKTADGDSVSLITLLQTQEPKNASLLYLTGNPRTRDLTAALPNHRITLLELYEAKPATTLTSTTQTALKEQTLTSISFFSSAAARTFVRLAPNFNLTTTRALCLSQNIGKELAPLNFSAIIVSSVAELPHHIQRTQGTK